MVLVVGGNGLLLARVTCLPPRSPRLELSDSHTHQWIVIESLSFLIHTRLHVYNVKYLSFALFFRKELTYAINIVHGGMCVNSLDILFIFTSSGER